LENDNKMGNVRTDYFLGKVVINQEYPYNKRPDAFFRVHNIKSPALSW
jgi:hypothetical protein